MSFYRETAIKAVRKPHQCLGCLTPVNVGEAALSCAGHYDGDFWSGHYHPDCRAAEIALNDLHDSPYEWMGLSEIEWDDWPWLIENFPAVAERIGATTAEYEEIVASQQRRWLAFAKEPSA